MNRRPHRPFFCFLLDIDQQSHFFRPTEPWGVELPGWGPCTSHPTGCVACRGMPWEEMADMQKLIPRYSKHFPRTEWLSDCWFYWCLDFHRNGRMITTINKPHDFSRESVKSGEILRRSAYFSDDDLNFTRGVVRCQGMWGPDSKCFKMVGPQTSPTWWVYWCPIFEAILHSYCIIPVSQAWNDGINSTWSTHVQHVPALKAKKNSKKGGMVDGFPMFPSLDGL